MPRPGFFAELCQDGFCRACHVSLSFEDCTDGTWSIEQLRRLGHSDDELRTSYPNAQQFAKLAQDIGANPADLLLVLTSERKEPKR